MKRFEKIKEVAAIAALFFCQQGVAQFAPPAGEEGTTAIHKDSSIIVNWASEVIDFERGLADISNPEGVYASYGVAEEALHEAEGNSNDVVSLGDAGVITLGFPYPIKNESGPDFAVFENSFSDDYLELAHVEVSTDGVHFVRLPSVSNTQTETQTGSFGTTEATKLYNLAGKYRQGFGTPFDLEDITDSTGINLDSINYVRIIDVVGSIDEAFGSMDSEGNMINDPFKTDFESGGFDLDAVAVIHEDNPFATVENAEIPVISAYPNPTNGPFYLKGIELKQVTVYNLTGEVILHQNNQNAIDFSQLEIPEGLYLLQVIDTNDNLHQIKVMYRY